jgi:hypothetical protein
MGTYVTSGRQVTAAEIPGLICPVCSRPAGLSNSGDTACSKAHAQSCGVLLHAFRVGRDDSPWECVVTDGWGNRVVEKPNLEKGTVDLVLAEPNGPTDPAPGPRLRVGGDGSVGVDVVWVK